MKISPARMAAFDVLLRIETNAAFSSVLLPQFEEGLDPRDRSLCHEVVLGVLRHQIELDRIIDALTRAKRLDQEIRVTLRIGLFQLKYLDRVPDHSAINESVELAARARKVSAKGFVNGVLRSYLRTPPTIAFLDDTDRISFETSHPRWLLEKWIECWGTERGLAIANANNEPGGVAFRPLRNEASEGSGRETSENVEGAYLADRLDDELRRLVDEGSIYLQDEASQMVALAIRVPSGGRFLDVCAAPGGKTGMIARAHPDSRTTAGDIHRARAEFLRANLDRQSVRNSDVVRYDAAEALPFADLTTFDAVLVDAPCSGTGTIRHNPEIRYSLRPEDLISLQGKQQKILNNASKTVKRGGLLVYSTCSLEPEENEAVAADFMELHNDFVLEPPHVPDKFLTANGFARTWPDIGGMDGFFIAAFRRL